MQCCQVYSTLRRKASKEAMKQQGFEKISIDEVQKMQWEALEGHMATWIKVVNHCNDQACFAERLFKGLDIYETPTELISAFDDSLYSKECADALRSDISADECADWEKQVVCIFYDLENSIGSDVAGESSPNRPRFIP
ncbi:hypothetical protein Nepgr_033919 [Nepenthes gracilis]|uniref:Uncharacterized protein n=1 Tax=Nepenthes gracilis TaxID=150966 RepID=A0AAD3TLA0_NEPGR|nr:hypothetical protein Nepgr_033919 [Nepenthes gracilis]